MTAKKFIKSKNLPNYSRCTAGWNLKKMYAFGKGELEALLDEYHEMKEQEKRDFEKMTKI